MWDIKTNKTTRLTIINNRVKYVFVTSSFSEF